MKNPFIVRPTGLKGNEKINRMRELMGATSLNRSESVV
jgi:nucleoside diphosphate kinase